MVALSQEMIYPGPSSQTSEVRIEHLIGEELVNMYDFEARAPNIQTPTSTAWNQAVKEVLEEHQELWERLAQL